MKLYVVFIVVALSFDAVRCDIPPTIVEQIEPIVAKLGATAVLNCTVADQGTSTVEWYLGQIILSSNDIIKNVVGLTIANIQKYQVIKTVLPGGNTRYSMIINLLQETDTSMYKCIIRIAATTPDSFPFIYANLTVLVPPQIIFPASTIAISVAVGSNVDFTCGARGSPSPNVTWGRASGQALDRNHVSWNVTKLSDRFIGYLHINGVTKEDRGTYRCSADNSVLPPADLFTKLMVEFVPEVQVVEPSYGSPQGDLQVATIWCRIAGNPRPTTYWFKLTLDERAAYIASNYTLPQNFFASHTALSDDQKYNIEQKIVTVAGLSMSTVDSMFYTLTVLQVQPADFTYYVCQGVNKYGRNYDVVQLYEVNDDTFSVSGGRSSLRSVAHSGSLAAAASAAATLLLLRPVLLT